MPEVLFWLMILLVALTLGGLAISIPRRDDTGQVVALVIVSVFFVTVVLLTRNLDPTAMTNTAQQVENDYVATYHAQPPCNDIGEPR